jgi:hypothetical protein
MSDYFDQLEREMREAVRNGAHLPWYLRLRPQLSRPTVAVIACLLATGSALAATGVLRSGAPVTATVPETPTAQEGVVIRGSAHLLALRVADPDGGPPWGLRVEKTTRGLTCVQLGRVVDGRIGVLGQDGAFSDDGAFHPLSVNFLNGAGCATEDAHGNAFLNEQIHGLPTSALLDDQQHTSGGCYEPRRPTRACPPSHLRDVYFGLLGPDATSITYALHSGGTVTSATAGADGAYLIVLAHSTPRCSRRVIFCVRGTTYATGGPELESSEVIRAVDYRDAPTCTVPTPAQAAETLEARMRAQRARHMANPEIVNRPGCTPIGYAPPRSSGPIPASRLASPISVRTEPAHRYCERLSNVVPCEHGTPKGYRCISVGGTPPEVLLVVGFTARIAVTNFDSHYEIKTTDPNDRADKSCPVRGAGTFGPTQTNLRAGQRVRYTMFVNPECRGLSHITVGFVKVDGPSGATPVPGLPGQSAEVPVGATNFIVP